MSKELEMLKGIKRRLVNDDWLREDNTGVYGKEYSIVEKALKDFEWLKSKIDVDFFYRLDSQDRIRLFEILGGFDSDKKTE